MTDRIYKVLFLCTGNSARSILAESILNQHGRGRFHAFSAGSQPTGRVNPFALGLLSELQFPTDGLRSKSWDEFVRANAPPIDFVITVCDNAAGEVCPIWPGRPATAHWGIPDPAAVEGSNEEKCAAFKDAFLTMARRISLFTSLPLHSLDECALKAEMRAIGQA